jgi:flagellar biogenesis protein FliO
LNGIHLNAASFNHDLCAPAAPDASAARRDPWRLARICWRRLVRLGRHAPRRLSLCESLPLGERRFVAVVEFEQARFLVGGTSTSLVLLARLENREGELARPRANPPATKKAQDEEQKQEEEQQEEARS